MIITASIDLALLPTLTRYLQWCHPESDEEGGWLDALFEVPLGAS